LLTLGFGHHSPRCWPKLFCVWPWTEKMAADHEAVVVLAQVASGSRCHMRGWARPPIRPLQEIRTHLDVRLQGNAENLARLARDLLLCSPWRTMSSKWDLEEPDTTPAPGSFIRIHHGAKSLPARARSSPVGAAP
jgi:hypothetical protein